MNYGVGHNVALLSASFLRPIPEQKITPVAGGHHLYHDEAARGGQMIAVAVYYDGVADANRLGRGKNLQEGVISGRNQTIAASLGPTRWSIIAR